MSSFVSFQVATDTGEAPPPAPAEAGEGGGCAGLPGSGERDRLDEEGEGRSGAAGEGAAVDGHTGGEPIQSAVSSVEGTMGR